MHQPCPAPGEVGDGTAAPPAGPGPAPAGRDTLRCSAAGRHGRLLSARPGGSGGGAGSAASGAGSAGERGAALGPYPSGEYSRLKTAP